MPSAPKPKTFVAARKFTYAWRHYKPGDEITERRVLTKLLRYGDRFIVAVRTKSAPAEPPADPPDTASPESI